MLEEIPKSVVKEFYIFIFERFMANISHNAFLTNLSSLVYFMHLISYSKSFHDIQQADHGSMEIKIKGNISTVHQNLFYYLQPIRFLSQISSSTVDWFVLFLIGLIVLGPMLYFVVVFLTTRRISADDSWLSKLLCCCLYRCGSGNNLGQNSINLGADRGSNGSSASNNNPTGNGSAAASVLSY